MWLDDLNVSCTEGCCAWRGHKRDLSGHKCPFPASDYKDETILQDIVYDDARSAVKLSCIEVLAQNVVNPRATRINVEKLELLYSYMQTYPWFIELQALGIKWFMSVLDATDGEEVLESVCNGWQAHIKEYISVGSIKCDIERLCGKYDEKKRKDMHA